MPHDAMILGMKDYEIINIKARYPMSIQARYTGPVSCPHCYSRDLRKKDRFIRKLRHETIGLRHSSLHLESHKYHCRQCGKYFNQRFPGIMPRRRSTEAFRKQIFWRHYDGICRKTLAEREKIGTATVERWFQDFLKLQDAKCSGAICPKILGIDEHFFSRKRGYATTFCDIKNHKVYDVVLGRSEKALEPYLQSLKGKERVELVCIDLANGYRSLVRKHFPNAKIVADRFHVIRLVNQQFMATWRIMDPVGGKNRGLISLIRRHDTKLSADQKQLLAKYFQDHPEVEAIYQFKKELVNMLLQKTLRAKQCRSLIPQLLEYIRELKECAIAQLAQLGRTLGSWTEEIACMWRFPHSNGVTEGFHNKMEMISRRSFGFRNFENYRLRVRVMCA